MNSILRNRKEHVYIYIYILYIQVCYSFNIHSQYLSLNVITERLKLVLFTNAQTSVFVGV